MDNEQFNQHLNEMVTMASGIEGHLTVREIRFLATLPFLTGEGEILEIGSFMGRSTTILAKSAIRAKRARIHACDPLLPSDTVPKFTSDEELPDLFHRHIRQHDVADIVEFYQVKSSELAKSWNLPLRILWIDGDHSYKGAMVDLEGFQRYLKPGAVVCIHDVLHEFEGPTRVLIEKILLSESFGACGICGSIGWGQYIGESTPTEKQWGEKISLSRKLSRLVPHLVSVANGLPSNRLRYKIDRARIPHSEPDLFRWLEERNRATIGNG